MHLFRIAVRPRSLRQRSSHSSHQFRLRGLEPLEQRCLLSVSPIQTDVERFAEASIEVISSVDAGSIKPEYAGSVLPSAGPISSTSLESVPPPGSLIYEQSADGSIDFAGDESILNIDLDAGQTLTVLAVPVGGSLLRPEIEVFDPSNALLDSSTAPAAGEVALLQTVFASSAGTYAIRVLGADGTSGSYQLQITLNSALEEEPIGLGNNDVAANAESIAASFIDLGGGVSRGAVIGRLSLPPGILTENEPNDDGVPGASIADLALANDATGSFVPIGGNDYEAHMQGTISVGGDGDWDFFRIQAQPGDSLHLHSHGVTLGDTYLWLFDQNGTFLAANDDYSSLDAQIFYSGFSYDGDYYAVADSYSGATGTYDLTATLTTLDPPPIGSADQADVFEIELSAGQSLTLTLAGPSGGSLGLELYDPSNAQVAAALNVQGSQRIDTYVASDPGTYYARVALGTSAGGQYYLIATKDAEFDGVPNESQEQAQDISGADGVLGFVRDPALPAASRADLLGGTAEFGATATANPALPPKAVSRVDAAAAQAQPLPVNSPATPSPAAASPALNPIPLLSDFAGPTDGRFVPPDPSAAAGPDRIVALVNSRFAIYDKATGAELLNQDMSGSGGFFGSTGTFFTIFDPHIVYDFESQRFFAVAIDVASSTQSNLYLAVSKDSSPSSTDDWYKYKIDFTDFTADLGTGAHFPDYEKVAVSSDAVWISGNYFPIAAGSGVYAGLTAIDKASVLSGGPADILYDEKFAGFSVFPIQSYGASSAQYFVESPWFGGNTLQVHAITNLLGTPVRSTTTVVVPAFDTPISVPGLGGNSADAIDARVLTGVWRDGSIWAAHSIRDPAIGDGEDVARWYEIDASAFPGGLATLVQAGNVDPGPGLHAWMPGLNVDGSGNMGIGFAVGGSSIYYAAGYTGRLASDPAGTTVLPISYLHDGESSYGSFRWGDYSALSIDPADDATFWMFHEYASGFHWQTHVGSFQLAPPEDVDWYRFEVNAGDSLELFTSTPADGPFDFTNLLDPQIELYGPDGGLIAIDNNSAPDGRNSSLGHSALSTGTYFVKVRGVGSSGEYVLYVSGATGADPAPEVAGTDPVDAAAATTFPATYSVRFSEAIALGSIDAGDLLISGVPALAVEMTSGDTLRFTLDPLAFSGDGSYSVVLPAGAVTDLQGTANVAYAGSFAVDTTPPHVVATTWNGAPLPADYVLPTGPFTFTATLSEDLTSSSSPRRGLRTPAADDVTLFGFYSGVFYSATSVSYDPLTNTFSATFGELPEDYYLLQLLSGDGHFEDLVGIDLDGDPIGPGLDGTPTGDGTAGGNYSAYFFIDVGTENLDSTWERMLPLGSLIYSTQAEGRASSAGDVDGFEFDLDAGQNLAAVATPEDPLGVLEIRVLAPDDTVLASATAAGPGQPVSLQNVPIAADGRYRVEVIGDSSNTNYALRLIRNATLEVTDGGPAIVAPLDGSFVDLGSGRYAAVGSTTGSTVFLSSLVWAVQPSTGQILKIDPATGQVLDSFPAPDNLLPSHTHIGLSIAEGGQALLYLNSDVDPTKLYRLDPVVGSVLSVETVSGFQVDGVGIAPVPGGGVEPDDYATGTDLTNVNPGVVITDDYSIGTITAQLASWATTGSQVFSSPIYGASGYAEFNSEFRATFAALVQNVSIDVGADDSSDGSVLRAYSAGGVLLEEVYSNFLSTGQSQTLSINRASADIKYVKAYGVNGDVSPLDNLQFGDPSGFTESIFLGHSGIDIHRQEGYSGSETFFWATGQPVGALGGDDTDRQFGFFSDGYIHEYDSNTDTDSFVSTLPAPAPDIEGLAYDGQWLYASTASGNLYTLNPNTGAIIDSSEIAGGGLYGLGAQGVPAPEGYFYFYLDPSQSTISAEEDVAGYELEEQLPGSLQNNLNGYIYASIFDDVLTLYSSDMYPSYHPGPFQPGNFDAQLAGEVEFAPGLTFSTAIRYLQLYGYGTTTLDPTGHFAPADLQLQTSNGELNYALPGFFNGYYYFGGFSPPNETASLGEFDRSTPGVYRISLPYDLLLNLEQFGGLDMELGLSGQILASADVGIPTMPFSIADQDNYSLDLTGKSGHHVDVVLTGQPGFDYSLGTQISLIGPDGHTVLATGTPIPLGTDALNFDLGILDFVVPADGVYTVRVQTLQTGEYSLVVTDELAFDTEPNSGDEALRSLDGTRGAIGYLDAIPVPFLGNYSLSIDSAATYLDLSGTLEDNAGQVFPVVEQTPGSTHVEFGGTVVVGIGTDTISLPGGSLIDALLKAGPFSPGNVAGDAAAKVDLGAGFLANGVFRDFIADLSSGAKPVAADGTFSVSDLTLGATSLFFDYELIAPIIGVFVSASENLSGSAFLNDTTLPGLIETVGDLVRVTIPIHGSQTVVEPTTSLILTLTFTGQIVATMPLPQPVDGKDDYTLELLAGEEWSISTETPLDGLDTLNTLDPSLVVIGPGGEIVATDTNSAPDGKNAKLTFLAPTDGTYRVVVLGEGGIGEYRLRTARGSAPRVTAVTVSSTEWTPSYLDYLESSGQGVGGYAMPVGSPTQYQSLPWSNIDQILISFDKDVVVSEDDLSVTGFFESSYAFAPGGFSYDPLTKTATWTLSQSFERELVEFELTSGIGSGVHTAGGLALDGEWDGASALPSGDGAEGGNFEFAMIVRPGDASGDNIVGANDYVIWADNFLNVAPYADEPSGDFNGDGVVAAADYTVWADNFHGAVVPGDAESNGTVDGADYSVWADNYQLSLPVGYYPAGDFNEDGIVDAADYTIWADNYSEPLVSAAAAPSIATTDRGTSQGTAKQEIDAALSDGIWGAPSDELAIGLATSGLADERPITTGDLVFALFGKDDDSIESGKLGHTKRKI